MSTELKKFLRIGTDYYMVDSIPTLKGESKERLINWKRSTIVDDHGIKSIQEVKKYKSFCAVPSHTNYKAEIALCYNKYQELSHRLKHGNFDNTKKFLVHIFGNQYELGMDYIGILWHYPSQILPILSLVSNERNTGKTTFLNWMKAIFEGNMTINKNEDFRSPFNSDWADKLVVAIDEVLLDKKEDSEMLKNLSTARHYKEESKGKDKREIDFFGKFILCSNNEDSFVKIDQEEIRYWVRDVPKLQSDDPFLLDKIIKEIPHFLYFINNRTIVSQNKTRMWFSAKQISTSALDILKKGNKTFNEKQLIESIEDELYKFELKEIRFSVG
ncbi:MAG: helicase, partial [Flavobacteriales bacterium]|nr:helicase [Flavobacteriales bacterium]